MNNSEYSARYAPISEKDYIFKETRHFLKIGITCPECRSENITVDHPSVTGNLSCFKCGRGLSGELCKIFWDSLPKTIRRQNNG